MKVENQIPKVFFFFFFFFSFQSCIQKKVVLSEPPGQSIDQEKQLNRLNAITEIDSSMDDLKREISHRNEEQKTHSIKFESSLPKKKKNEMHLKNYNDKNNPDPFLVSQSVQTDDQKTVQKSLSTQTDRLQKKEEKGLQDRISEDSVLGSGKRFAELSTDDSKKSSVNSNPTESFTTGTNLEQIPSQEKNEKVLKSNLSKSQNVGWTRNHLQFQGKLEKGAKDSKEKISHQKMKVMESTISKSLKNNNPFLAKETPQQSLPKNLLSKIYENSKSNSDFSLMQSTEEKELIRDHFHDKSIDHIEKDFSESDEIHSSHKKIYQEILKNYSVDKSLNALSKRTMDSESHFQHIEKLLARYPAEKVTSNLEKRIFSNLNKWIQRSRDLNITSWENPSVQENIRYGKAFKWIQKKGRKSD